MKLYGVSLWAEVKKCPKKQIYTKQQNQNQSATS